MCVKISAKIIQQFEGFRANTYICAGGYKTIGFGHKLKPSEIDDYKTCAITKEVANELLEQDINQIQSGIARLIKVPLSQNQLVALISFTFNLGLAALQRSTLRMCVNREEHEAASEEFLRWDKVHGYRLAGLTKRRSIESRIYIGHLGINILDS